MATQLSATTQLKIEQALDQYRHWQVSPPLRPGRQQTLPGGRSNVSVKVSAQEQQFVIRVDGPHSQRLGLNRAVEWRVQTAAWQRGLAPRPIYFNPELGVLVSQYCAAPRPRWEPGTELPCVARLLRRIHELPKVKYRLQPLDRAHRYCGLLQRTRVPGELETLCLRLQRSATICLCHNDLLRGNRLGNADQLLAVDWEYAASGDPWFELAAICEGDELSSGECRQLVNAYLGCEPSRRQRQRLSDYRQVYAYLTELWERITAASAVVR